MIHVKVSQFEGPYDLLLTLIQDQELDITEIAISEVTEQFLNHLDSLDQEKPEELADFLVVATKLLLHKSRILLPQFGPQEDEGPSLEDQLKLYKQFVDASKSINEMWLSDTKGAYRIEPPRKAEGFMPGTVVTLERLHESMLQLVHRLAPPKAIPQAHIDKTVSMKEKIDTIRTLLKKSKNISFHEVLESSQNRTEVIVGFIALLELFKDKTIAITQDENFGDIMINSAA